MRTHGQGTSQEPGNGHIAMLRGMAKGIARQVDDAAADVTDPDARVALLTAMQAVDTEVERLICTLKRSLANTDRGH